MSITLDEVVDLAELTDLLREGMVSMREHESEPLAIINYTEKATFAGNWTEGLRQCRGLIYRTDNGEVVARGYPKFFNWNEPSAGITQDDMHKPIVAYDKIDGSLGIVYWRPEAKEWAVATRGSFHSPMATWATENLHRYATLPSPQRSTLTYLCEIVYPQNRIVLDYGDKESLTLLGGVDLRRGYIVTPSTAAGEARWSALHVAPMVPEPRTLKDAVLLERKDVEGLVCHMPDGSLVKVKQSDYIERHRVRFGMNELRVWEALSNGNVDDLYRDAPEEFHPWLDEKVSELHQEHDAIISNLEDEYHELDLGETRREAARAISESTDQSAMWLIYDNKDDKLVQHVYRKLRPLGGGELAQSSSKEKVSA